MSTRAQNVYVIGLGERGEGSDPVAVTRTLQAARQYVYDRFGTFLQPQPEPRHWMAYQSPNNPVDQVHVHRIRIGARP